MARKIAVEITGDSRSLERAFDRSGSAAQDFSKRMQRSSVSTAKTFDPLLEKTRQMRERFDDLERREQKIHEARRRRFDEITIGTGKVVGGAVVFSQALGGLADISQALTGPRSELSHGLTDAATGITSLMKLDVGGFIGAATAGRQRTRDALARYLDTLTDPSQIQQALKVAQGAAAMGLGKQAAAIRARVKSMEAMSFAGRPSNVTVIGGKNRLIEFKGPVDSMNIRGGLRGTGGVEMEKGALAANIRPIVVQTDVYLDGEKVGRATKRASQRDSIRSPKQKRGPQRGPLASCPAYRGCERVRVYPALL
jgi:hypothetical protein